MNRQIRRVEEKKDKKQEEKKRKAREEKKAKRRERAERRKANARRHQEARAEGGNQGKQAPVRAGGGGNGGAKAAKAGQDGKAGRRGGPGRFSGALMVATIFFVSLQAVTPTDGSVLNQIVSASFYLLFGYFSVLWMMRRGTTTRPIALAVAAGLTLGVATAVARWLQPDLALEPLTFALIPPLLVAGAFLGRLVHLNAPG